jgi:hypothetical protein
MPESYSDYQSGVLEKITSCIDNMGCQPILFIGTGFSRRYFDAPDWRELLIQASKSCPNIDKEFDYYYQKYSNNLIDVAEAFVPFFHEWAWSVKDSGELPPELFEGGKPSSTYLKYIVSAYLQRITPSSIESSIPTKLRDELSALQRICPHSIITTNYDEFIEVLFSDYQKIIGEKILRTDNVSIGEIFKIHGCVSVPDSLVLTRTDYQHFVKKRKYLSAKLLTYFAEHPLLFIGYSASDPNIRELLSDIDEILSPRNGLIEHVFYLSYDKDARLRSQLPDEELIPIQDGKYIRVNQVVASDFAWVFDAFCHRSPLPSLNVKVLRSLLSRAYRLVRSDIPSGLVHVDFSTIERLTNSTEEFEKVFGICRLDDPAQISATFPYAISQLAKHLGYTHWHYVRELMGKIITEKGVDIYACDNKYHVAIKVNKSVFHKYSDEALLLLQKVRDGLPYEIDAPVLQI